MQKDHWYVKETAILPNSFKIKNDRFRDDNGTYNYFPSREKAQEVCDKRNAINKPAIE